MYKIMFLLFTSISPFVVEAQVGNVLKRAKDKALGKVNTRIDEKMDKAIDETLDEIEGKKPSNTNTTPNNQPSQPQTNPGLQSYAKYDFVPGEKIVYVNDFEDDVMGELPVGWNSNGTGAVVTISGLAGNWVQLHQNSVYLTDNKDSLTENFTVEFDLVLRRTNPKVPFPAMVFGMLASGPYEPGASELLKGLTNTFATELKMQPYDNNGSQLHLQTYSERRKHLETDIKKMGELQQFFNKVIHVAIQVQKERMRIWFNETKLYDLPKAIVADAIINQLYFDVKRYGGPDTEVGYAIGNIKIAKGLPDSKHKLMKEGNFSTTGILFDINSANIKPESAGALKEIADVLNQFPEIKVKIIGHTDSDGSESANLELSKKRSEAVKQALIINYNIDGSRMESDGKGELNPVTDNGTKKGKAQNRRVEFTKIQ